MRACIGRHSLKHRGLPGPLGYHGSTLRSLRVTWMHFASVATNARCPQLTRSRDFLGQAEGPPSGDELKRDQGENPPASPPCATPRQQWRIDQAGLRLPARRQPGHIAPIGETGTDARRQHARVLLDQLSEREREVALTVGQGRSNAEISRELYMSVPTVKQHVSRILTKAGPQQPDPDRPTGPRCRPGLTSIRSRGPDNCAQMHHSRADTWGICAHLLLGFRRYQGGARWYQRSPCG